MAEILEAHQTLPLTTRQEQLVEDALRLAREHARSAGRIDDDAWSAYHAAREVRPTDGRMTGVSRAIDRDLADRVREVPDGEPGDGLAEVLDERSVR